MHFYSVFIFTFLSSQIGPSHSKDVYDNHYDLKARDAAYLCVLMDEYLKTGKQPSLTQKTPASLTKDELTKGKPCWKFAWTPCDPEMYQHTTQRPCGWYQMKKTDTEDECN